MDIAALADLLARAGAAHHAAFAETGGEDPDWPLWYADYLYPRLGDAMAGDLTRSEIVYLLVAAARSRLDEDDGPWHERYAEFIASQLT